jgi:effector-binding domain-containing protein
MSGMQRRGFFATMAAGVAAGLAAVLSGVTHAAAGRPAPARAPAYRIEVLTLTTQPVLSIRAQVAPAELDAKMRALMPRLVAYCMTSGIELAGPPFARYFARSAVLVDFEAGVPTIKEQPGNAALGITVGTLPAGPAIATVHQGAYERLPEAHAALARWARAHGKQAGGAGWEVFLTNPVQERAPARWRTKVFLPLATR